MTRRAFATSLALPLVALAIPGCTLKERPERFVVSELAPAYDIAVDTIQKKIAAEAADALIRPEGVSLLFTHGKRVRSSVLLFHGFTNVPRQFEELARAYFAAGCNVYTPRLPRHGLKDRMTNDLAGLTVTEIQNAADEGYSLARGLGARVTVLGLSLGGAMALWLTQTQPVDLTVPIAPFLMPLGYAEPVINAAAHVAYALPSFYCFWDSKLKEHALPNYAYPGYPTHAMAELVFFGEEIAKLAAADRPRAKDCTLVTNSGENAVSNDAARRLLARWNARGANYTELVLTDIGLPRHDIVDPVTFPAARTLVYPVLEKIVAN
ncbi:MAG TPA: alpha/beta fold hydrolase [Candidatus Acidoferrales bacterium]|nr:alpha/beta fold hydrolase [Candidatus Acidoferrales bacterium]